MTESIPEPDRGPARPEKRENLVQFDLGQWRFSAPLVPVLGALFMLPILVSLGFWQLDRAAERSALILHAQTARDQPALLPANAQLLEAAPRYLPVSLRGSVDARRQFLLDNRVNGKVVGYEVLAPLIYKPGKAILVNRGWLPVGDSRAVKPDVSLPLEMDEVIDLKGLAVVPPSRFNLGDALNANDEWPRVLQFEDFESMSVALELDLLPRVVQPEDVNWGYESVWKAVEKGPEQNYAYALQWFALAATLFLIVVVVCVRRRPGDV